MGSIYLEQLEYDLAAAFPGGVHYYVFIAALIYIWFAEKKWRRWIVIPTVILLIVLFNPICYVYVWPTVVDYAFSRLLWLVPVVPVIAAACVSLILKCRGTLPRIALAAAFVLLITRMGQYVYKTEDNWAGAYYRTENIYHLPEEIIEISDFLLEQDPRPRVVADMDLSAYLRMYSPDIQLYTGRYYYYLRYRKQKEMQEHLIGLAWDPEWLRDKMKNENYSYLVMRNDRVSPVNMEKCGFSALRRFDTPNTAYVVYKLE